MEITKPPNVTYKICSKCEETKSSEEFYKRGSICCECNNSKRRQKYKENEEHRKKLIQMATEFKHKKVVERQQLKEEEQIKIGLENKQCKYCNEVKHQDRFRHNRLKCKDCERDEPNEKFKRYIRTRIYNCLRYKNKTKHSVEYLGCSSDEYFKWIFNYDNNYSLENHGKEWHIDHVIPISKFDLSQESQQLLAFNWKNTMPLSSKENLVKNNKIIKEQIKEHLNKLKEYHIKHNIQLPQIYINLFARYLDAGNPLEPSLPLTIGNICEELV
jgi:hypothetical protein